MYVRSKIGVAVELTLSLAIVAPHSRRFGAMNSSMIALYGHHRAKLRTRLEHELVAEGDDREASFDMHMLDVGLLVAPKRHQRRVWKREAEACPWADATINNCKRGKFPARGFWVWAGQISGQISNTF